MSLYTKTGDDGTTALFGGKRVLKCEELVDVYGSIDELNSVIGLLRSTTKNKKDKELLGCVQNDLFLIGSILAGWNGDLAPLTKQVFIMEGYIDQSEKTLQPLSHFILPGGSKDASLVHIARSITRRVERQVVSLLVNKSQKFKKQEYIQRTMITYLNRLSDLLFMMARGINKKAGVKETIWIGTPTKRKG